MKKVFVELKQKQLMLLKIITNTLKKVLFIDDKNSQQVHNICCSGSGIKTDL